MRTNRPIAIEGVMRPYDWGIHNGLSEWTRVTTDGPQAELWFGAHPSAPSPLLGSSTTLDSVLGEVPLLTKILAAATPLSLQVHPTADQAIAWRAEQADLLSDDIEKVEMLIALQDFLALVGWRSLEEAGTILSSVGATDDLLSAIESGERRKVIEMLFDQHRISAPAQTWADAAAGVDEVSSAVMFAVADKFGDDPGVAVAALLQARSLQKGDAVYLPAGVPHAYVDGLGVEVMTSSDNVLRMGLTSKTVALGHALQAVSEEIEPQLITTPSDGEYAPADAPFRVTFITNDPHRTKSGNYRLVLAIAGGVTVAVDDTETTVEAGQALVLAPECPNADIMAHGHSVLVSQEIPKG
ncbi:MAG: mannose-6-phosphate isomerase, class I [Actinobacteria bacterium]|nr:mannose-6-phosphate isomerase, class I [Actinomycetota bacterium]